MFPAARRSSTGSGEKPCAQSPLTAFSGNDWTLSTPGFEALRRFRLRPNRSIAALLTPQRSERLMVPTLHRRGAPGVPEFENLPGGIRQPPFGAGRQPPIAAPPMRAAGHEFGDVQLFAPMPDRDPSGMLDRLETLLARYLRRKRPRRLRCHFLGNDPARLLGERRSK